MAPLKSCLDTKSGRDGILQQGASSCRFETELRSPQICPLTSIDPLLACAGRATPFNTAAQRRGFPFRVPDDRHRVEFKAGRREPAPRPVMGWMRDCPKSVSAKAGGM